MEDRPELVEVPVKGVRATYPAISAWRWANRRMKYRLGYMDRLKRGEMKPM